MSFFYLLSGFVMTLGYAGDLTTGEEPKELYYHYHYHYHYYYYYQYSY